MSPWFCREKCSFLYNFVGQSPHCSMKVRSNVWRLHEFVGKFAPQVHGAMQTLPWKMREQWRLCPAKSWRNSFKDQKKYEISKISLDYFLKAVFIFKGYMIIMTTFWNTLILQDGTSYILFSNHSSLARPAPNWPSHVPACLCSLGTLGHWDHFRRPNSRHRLCHVKGFCSGAFWWGGWGVSVKGSHWHIHTAQLRGCSTESLHPNI